MNLIGLYAMLAILSYFIYFVIFYIFISADVKIKFDYRFFLYLGILTATLIILSVIIYVIIDNFLIDNFFKLSGSSEDNKISIILLSLDVIIVYNLIKIIFMIETGKGLVGVFGLTGKLFFDLADIQYDYLEKEQNKIIYENDKTIMENSYNKIKAINKYLENGQNI